MSELNSVLLKEIEQLKNHNNSLYKKNKNLKRSNLRFRNKYVKLKNINDKLNCELVNVDRSNNIDLEANDWEDVPLINIKA